jgi:hypothetical protein
MAGKKNFVIEEGATFRRIVRLRRNGAAINLTGCSAVMEIRPRDEVAFNLAPPRGQVEIAGAEGKITLLMPATETAQLAWSKSSYDLLLTYSNGDVQWLLTGEIIVVHR